MNGWPLRGGYRWRILVPAPIVFLSGCLFMGSGGGLLSAGSGRAAPVVPPIEPAMCGGEVQLSTVQADTGKRLTEQQMLGHVMANSPKSSDDLWVQTVVVEEGVGSFSMAMPRSYGPFWRAGTPLDILLDDAWNRDQEWARYQAASIARGAVDTRATMVDLTIDDAVSAVDITLSGAYPLFGEDLAAVVGSLYTETGMLLGEQCGVRVNGNDGAYLEYAVPGELVQSSVDRVQLQYLIPDPPNDLLWGVTCDVPATLADEVKPVCREMAASFRPLPGVVR